MDAWGGVLGVTKGLYPKYPDRVLDTPISESAFIGAAVGAACSGLRPVAELMFVDFMGVCFDQIYNQGAKLRYMFGGKARVPMVIRTMWGAGIRAASQHSQSLYPIFTHIPGLKVAIPSNPYDAKGLLIAAIEDPDPVMFLEPKRLYNGPFDGHHEKPVTPWSKHDLGEVPDGHYTIPIGKAEIRRPGNAVTVIAYGTMVHVALAAAEETGLDAEVIDLRSLLPLDLDTIVQSVKKTGRCVVVHEATLTSGFGGEVVSLVQEHCFYNLEAPIVRVTGWDTPYPHAQEWDYFPGPARVGRALKEVMEG
jgi:2-oxoisovalerate dehydrogenase E1 component beta subunit